MRKLTTYWHVLLSSLSTPEYYFTLRSVKIFFSVQFFLFSLFLIALFEIPNWAIRIIPPVISDFRQEAAHAFSQIPEDAVFTYDGKQLTTQGLKLPTLITSSKKAQDLGYPKNLIEITSEDKASDAAVTLTPDRLLYLMVDPPASETKYTDLFGEEKGTLSRDQIRTAVYSFLDAILTNKVEIALALAVFGFFSSIVSGAFTILIYSLFVQVLGWMLGVRITYKFAVRWGLHIFPICLAIQELSSLFTTSGSFPILVVSYIAIATVILWTGRTQRPTIVLK